MQIFDKNLFWKTTMGYRINWQQKSIIISLFVIVGAFIIYVHGEDMKLPFIYVVTPTYRRPEMMAELTRLGQTLTLVSRVHWMVAEDSSACSPVIDTLIQQLGLPYTHLLSPMPEVYRHQRYVPRGVSNRRAAIEWLQDNAVPGSILYFLDDDNAVDIRLFEEMRLTLKVSMWPVGLVGTYAVSSPVVKNNAVVGFYDSWPSSRKFQVDMAGFAVNLDYLKLQEKVTMPYTAGHEEDGFLRSLNVSLADLEPRASSCTQVLVWHTRSLHNPVRQLKLDEHKEDNIRILTEGLRQMGMIK